MEHELTSKQARFVDEYLADANGTQAAIRAGYSPRSAAEIAYELLRKPQIERKIRSKADACAREAGITRTEAVSNLVEAAEHAKTCGDAKAMIKAWHTIARLLDLYPRST